MAAEAGGGTGDGGGAWRDLNRAWWDEATPLHAASALYDLDGFRAGANHIRPFELVELGSVAGLDLVHLQCHIGTDTLSWARLGARVVGLDFSAPAMEVARDLARDCGLDAEFVCADVYDSAAALGGRRFDVVYTGIGAVGWLPDLDRWAAVVASLLRPGGVVYLAESHPLVPAVSPDGRTVSLDIMDAPLVEYDEVGGTYAAPDAQLAATRTVERLYSPAEVVSALLGAGLVLELLHEHAYTPAPAPWLDRGDDGYYRLPPGFPRYPLMYSVRARRPA